MTSNLQTKEQVRRLVDARLAVLLEEQPYTFGTIGPKPKSFKNRVSDFMHSPSGDQALHSAANKVFDKVHQHHKDILGHAMVASLYHVVGTDFPTETADLIHHKVANLSNDLSVTAGRAHQMMSHAVTKLKAFRGLHECEKDDELDAALHKLHKVLKDLEPRYKTDTKPGYHPDKKESIIHSLVAARLAEKDQYMFGTIGDQPKSDIHSRIKNFVNHPRTQHVIHSASKVAGAVANHHMLTTAVALSLSHVAPHEAHVILGTDSENLVHHEIEHLATNMKIGKDMAHHMMTHAVSKMKELRGLKEADDFEKDDELDATLHRLHQILKKIEPQYKRTIRKT
jgi:hypothetical protein